MEIPLFSRFSFVVVFVVVVVVDDDYLLVCSSCRDRMICLYLKIPDKCLHLIFKYGSWGYAYTTYSYGQIETSCTITSGLPSPSSFV